MAPGLDTTAAGCTVVPSGVFPDQSLSCDLPRRREKEEDVNNGRPTADQVLTPAGTSLSIGPDQPKPTI